MFHEAHASLMSGYQGFFLLLFQEINYWFKNKW